jgi:hypothetical protein
MEEIDINAKEINMSVMEQAVKDVQAEESKIEKKTKSYMVVFDSVEQYKSFREKSKTRGYGSLKSAVIESLKKNGLLE